MQQLVISRYPFKASIMPKPCTSTVNPRHWRVLPSHNLLKAFWWSAATWRWGWNYKDSSCDHWNFENIDYKCRVCPSVCPRLTLRPPNILLISGKSQTLGLHLGFILKALSMLYCLVGWAWRGWDCTHQGTLSKSCVFPLAVGVRLALKPHHLTMYCKVVVN